MTLRVLVTGAGALLGQGILRSFRGMKRNVELVAVDPSPLAAGLYWADRGHLVPMANAPNYLDRMRALLEHERPDVVFIGTDVELAIFAAHRAALEREFETHIIVSDPRVIAIADDKYKTFEFLRDNGFAYPRTALAEDAAGLVDEVGFPLIVKPRVGARSVGVVRVEDHTALRRCLEQPEGLMVQELAGDDAHEYTAGVLCFDGEVRASIVMRRDLRDGNTYRAYVDNTPSLNDAVRAMGRALKPYGPANFQFRTDPDGVPRVFEINGRFSGTTPLRALAGFNEVEMCIDAIVDGRPITQPLVQEKIFLRHWSETVLDRDALLQEG